MCSLRALLRPSLFALVLLCHNCILTSGQGRFDLYENEWTLEPIKVQAIQGMANLTDGVYLLQVPTARENCPALGGETNGKSSCIVFHGIYYID